jgi:hypothetical protein
MSTMSMNWSARITRAHLERLAVVYVRQSTLAQVRDHGESTQRQYALTDDAERLGWPAEQVLVIDADLGVSGRGGSARTGFKDLVGRVCCGEVGAVLGLEVSRLARSSADLQRLLELCSLTDTLIIDGEGIYDLGLFNDRLLLGLKGTMSEAELHLLAFGARAADPCAIVTTRSEDRRPPPPHRPRPGWGERSQLSPSAIGERSARIIAGLRPAFDSKQRRASSRSWVLSVQQPAQATSL